MLTLPWPPSILNPNRIAHWAQKSKVKAKYKSDCYFLVKSQPPRIFKCGDIHLTLIFHPPTRRKFDMDNALAAMKSGLDGVALAWGINDCLFRPITIDSGEVVKGGSVELSVSQK